MLGLGFGYLWGLLSSFVPERNDPFVVPLRIFLLLAGGFVSVVGSDLIGLGAAGPLGCVAVAFMSLIFWSRQGWTIDGNPAATVFRLFWLFCEPVLFGITGASVKFSQIDSKILWICIVILISGAVIRLICTVFLGIGCHLNLKEKIFVAVACIAKATVQVTI